MFSYDSEINPFESFNFLKISFSASTGDCSSNAVVVTSRAVVVHPKKFDDPKSYKVIVIAKGLPASPGAAVGQVVFSAEDAETWQAEGKTVILIRTETSPEDVGGMHAAAGILTARGGITSHAYVVARG